MCLFGAEENTEHYVLGQNISDYSMFFFKRYTTTFQVAHERDESNTCSTQGKILCAF